MNSKAREIAKERQSTHLKAGNRSDRFFEDPLEEESIGAAGELAFGRLFNVRVDRNSRPKGDGGIDFEIPWYLKVDVKTARVPKYLFVKDTDIDKPIDIYVLAHYKPDGEIEFLGWATRSQMKKQPTQQTKYGFTNHYLRADQLRPMQELIERSQKTLTQNVLMW